MATASQVQAALDALAACGFGSSPEMADAVISSSMMLLDAADAEGVDLSELSCDGLMFGVVRG